MAMLMLSVGDMQVCVRPVGQAVACAPEFQAVWESLPDGHPLKAGDHEVVFFEHGMRGDDAVAQAILGEADALEVVGLWLTLEMESEGEATRRRLVELMGEEIAAFLP